MWKDYQYQAPRFLSTSWYSEFSMIKRLSLFRHRKWFAPAVSIIILLGVLASCENGDDATGGQPTQTDTNPAEDVVITIGNLTDLTGVSATAMDRIHKALEDMVKYYNDQNLIPGVKINIETYDGQYDPSKDIPGYEYLKNKGADLIWAPAPVTAITLKPIVSEDKIPMFVASTGLDTLTPPGYTFSLGTIPHCDSFSFLKWIAENDWDYQTNGPAKIGGAAWSDGISNAQFEAMKNYIDAHPDQYEWIGGFLTDFSFSWTTEIEALKDCDYVYPPIPMHTFVRDYYKSGGKAQLIGTDPHAGFLDMIDKGEYWDEIDGMLFIRGSRWWTEEGPIIDLTKELLYSNHGLKAEEIMRSGVGYLSAAQSYQLCEIIRLAAENVGPENIDSRSIYQAAVSYQETIDGVNRYSFNDTKRCSTNYYVIYKVDGERKDLFRVDPDWVSVSCEP